MLNKNNKLVIKNNNKKIKKIITYKKDIIPPSIMSIEEVPHITLYHYSHKQTDETDINIPLYFTDFYQKDYKFDDYSERFKVRYEVDGNVGFIENVLAGDFNLNLGTLAEGMHYYTVQIEDSHGRKSRRICNDLWIINESNYEIKPSEIYTMTNDDLVNYSINNSNSDVLEDMINNRVGLSQLFKDRQSNGFRKIILLPGTYRVNRTIRMGVGNETPIDIPTNFTVDMNGCTFKLHEYSDTEYGNIAQVENLMIRMKNCFDSHLINGIIEGDYFERQSNGWISGSNGEHNNAFYSYGGEFCSLDNITVKQTTGYNICSGQAGSYGSGKDFGTWTDNTTIENGVEIYKENYVTSSLGYMDTAMLENKYIVASVWLAVGYLKGYSWDMDFHFYNANKEYMESIQVYQFTRCRIPEGAKHFRITFRNCKSSDIGDLSIHHMNVCRYFEVNNCHWIDNRTCAAPFQSQHYTFNNCTFTRSGQDITPCEIDLEDGWEQQQDIYIRGCEILENVGTGDVIDNSGINHHMENCKNFGMISRYRINGLTLRNNMGFGVGNTLGWMTGNTIRIYGNQLSSLGLSHTDEGFYNNEKIKIHVRNNQINSGYLDFGSQKFYEVENNTLYINGVMNNVRLNNNIIYRYGIASYINGNIEINNCTYKLHESETLTKFSFNVANVKRIYKDCIYENPCHFATHNYFNSGNWINCTFKETLHLQPKTATLTMGQIQFNNCIFEKSIKIDLGTSTYVQFNNCTFLGGKEYIGTSESRCEFNNEIPSDVTYIKCNKVLDYLELNKTYTHSAELLPYTASDLKPRWSVSNSSLATINSNGDLVANAVGEIDIIATSHNGLSNSIHVNLVDVDYTTGSVYNATGGYATSSFGVCNNKYIPVVGGSTMKLQYGSNMSITYGYIVQYNSNKEFIKANTGMTHTDKSFTVALDSNTAYIRIAIWRGSTENKFPELFSTYSITYQ